MKISFIDEWLVIVEDTGSGSGFVVHTTKPRFVVRIFNTPSGRYHEGKSEFHDKCSFRERCRVTGQAKAIFRDYDKKLDID